MKWFGRLFVLILYYICDESNQLHYGQLRILPQGVILFAGRRWAPDWWHHQDEQRSKEHIGSAREHGAYRVPAPYAWHHGNQGWCNRSQVH